MAGRGGDGRAAKAARMGVTQKAPGCRPEAQSPGTEKPRWSIGRRRACLKGAARHSPKGRRREAKWTRLSVLHPLAGKMPRGIVAPKPVRAEADAKSGAQRARGNKSSCLENSEMNHRNDRANMSDRAKAQDIEERKASYRRRVAAAGIDLDKMPEDIDEFRYQLARLIAMYVN